MAMSTTLNQDEKKQLSIFLETIHRPLSLGSSHGVESLRGCVFSTSGFSSRKYRDDDHVPTKYDIEAAIALVGGKVGPGGMIEGITTHLICFNNRGEKYEAATRWGPEKIRIVSWTWLLRCLLCSPTDTQGGGALPTSASQSQPDFDFYASQATQLVRLSGKRPQVNSSSQDMGVGREGYPDSEIIGSDQKRAKCSTAVTAQLPPVESSSSSSSSPRRCFLLGGGSDIGFYASSGRTVLEGLGATVVWPLETKFELCTHVILWELKRTEKFLCAVASGRWILRPQYIEASQTAGRLLAEEEFEWRGESALAKACRFQRMRRTSGGAPRLFSGKSFAVVGLTLPPADTLLRVIDSGGGTGIALSFDEYRSSSLRCEELTAIIAAVPTSSCLDALQNLRKMLPVLTPAFVLDSVCAEDEEMSPSMTDPKYDVFTPQQQQQPPSEIPAEKVEPKLKRAKKTAGGKESKRKR
jgi:hypothetical protein